MNKYKCSDGSKVSQATINARLTKCYKRMGAPRLPYPDSGYIEHDHTISQARCKQLHKTELIWDQDNIEFSSREAHKEWESYKSGTFEDHANVVRRLLFVKKHDTEGFMKRYFCLSNYKIQKAVNQGL